MFQRRDNILAVECSVFLPPDIMLLILRKEKKTVFQHFWFGSLMFCKLQCCHHAHSCFAPFVHKCSSYTGLVKMSQEGVTLQSCAASGTVAALLVSRSWKIKTDFSRYLGFSAYLCRESCTPIKGTIASSHSIWYFISHAVSYSYGVHI